MPTPRNTSIRDRHRKQIARSKPPCSYEHCLYPGEPIDYTADHLDPKAFTVDHIVPLNKGGTDTLDNKQPAHRACNRAKSDHTDEPPGIRTYATTRRWW